MKHDTYTIHVRSLMTWVAVAILALSTFIAITFHPALAQGAVIPTIDAYEARPPIHVMSGASNTPRGMTPAEVKAAYHLPSTGGSGTIAIVSAYDHTSLDRDLSAFSKAFTLNSCTVANKCLEIHAMDPVARDDSGWAMESALDVEWSHAIAPKARILVVEAASASGKNLLAAIDYARSRSDVVAVSMSWGGGEFTNETALESHFAPTRAGQSITFLAASGDDGYGASWPAASPRVIAVGGTSLQLDVRGAFVRESAWSGSGGGVSAFETEPAYQKDFNIPRAGGKRAIPDVSFAADPAHGFSVIHNGLWYVVGGTSASTPAWAGIVALAHAANKVVDVATLYSDKAGSLYSRYFRDIVSGTNGSCAYYCLARKHYDYVTGLGSPVTYKF